MMGMVVTAQSQARTEGRFCEVSIQHDSSLTMSPYGAQNDLSESRHFADLANHLRTPKRP